jgi:hypothetical protein
MHRRWPAVVVGVLLCATLVVDFAALIVARLTSPLRPPVGAAGRGEGTLPVVLVAGLMSRGDGFAALTAALQAEGTPVLDFDPSRPGAQPFTFVPASEDQHVRDIAVTLLQPAIREALVRGGVTTPTVSTWTSSPTPSVACSPATSSSAPAPEPIRRGRPGSTIW